MLPLATHPEDSSGSERSAFFRHRLVCVREHHSHVVAATDVAERALIITMVVWPACLPACVALLVALLALTAVGVGRVRRSMMAHPRQATARQLASPRSAHHEPRGVWRSALQTLPWPSTAMQGRSSATTATHGVSFSCVLDAPSESARLRSNASPAPCACQPVLSLPLELSSGAFDEVPAAWEHSPTRRI
ncbi:hypothetical protein BKA63DRAFT_595719 [Paraphoma chrysanthemicola]|nr:hypothetical protein BKA63DRAFT_595719 [Paraphoma chrysanthemicola]